VAHHKREVEKYVFNVADDQPVKPSVQWALFIAHCRFLAKPYLCKLIFLNNDFTHSCLRSSGVEAQSEKH
jgi:hypothetical protein